MCASYSLLISITCSLVSTALPFASPLFSGMGCNLRILAIFTKCSRGSNRDRSAIAALSSSVLTFPRFFNDLSSAIS